MIDLDRVPPDGAPMTLPEPVLPATDDEGYVTPSDVVGEAPAFPARIRTEGTRTEPAFRATILDRFLAWRRSHSLSPSPATTWYGDTVVITDGDTVHQLTPDRNGRHRLPDQNWYAVGPEDPDHDAQLLADPFRYEPLPGETFLQPNLDLPGHRPSSVAPSFPGCATFLDDDILPWFRRPVAEAVAAWINIHRRIWAFDGDCAYWHNNTLVLVTIGEDMLAGRAPTGSPQTPPAATPSPSATGPTHPPHNHCQRDHRPQPRPAHRTCANQRWTATAKARG